MMDVEMTDSDYLLGRLEWAEQLISQAVELMTKEQIGQWSGVRTFMDTVDPEQGASPPEKWLIWSFEHHAWWRPQSAGYTKDGKHAGLYDFNEAVLIMENANHGCEREPNEAMIPVFDAQHGPDLVGDR